jgi:hypothetical protein
MGSCGNFYFVAVKKKTARNFLMKISRISPLTALNKMALKIRGSSAIKI